MVLAFAPRIPRRLLVALDWIDDRSLPIAEVNRRLGAEAWRLGLPRPSYQRVRELVHQLRRMRSQPTTLGVLWDSLARSPAGGVPRSDQRRGRPSPPAVTRAKLK
jgi:hypothetical protein